MTTKDVPTAEFKLHRFAGWDCSIAAVGGAICSRQIEDICSRVSRASCSRMYLTLTFLVASLQSIRWRVGPPCIRRRRWRMNLCFSRFGVPLSVAFLELNFGKLRFRQRQRHMIAGRDHIELARNEHNESAGMVNATSDASGVIPGPPVEISTRRSDDRRSRILRNHQASE